MIISRNTFWLSTAWSNYEVIKVILPIIFAKIRFVRYIKKRHCVHWWVKVIPSWSLKSTVDQISLCCGDIFGNNSLRDYCVTRTDQSEGTKFSINPMRGTRSRHCIVWVRRCFVAWPAFICVSPFKVRCWSFMNGSQNHVDRLLFKRF